MPNLPMLDINQIKRKNKEFFDNDQLYFYEISNNPIQEFFNKRLTASFTKFIKYIPKKYMEDKCILDAGCNDGFLFDFYNANGAKKIVGCDIAGRAMLRGLKRGHGILRGRGKALKIKYFAQGDLELMPLKDSSFDSVFCFGTWHHIVNKDKFLKECRRVLNNNGFLIITDVNNLHPLRKVVNMIGTKMNGLLDEECRNHVNAEVTKNMLLRCGFNQMRTYHYNLFSPALAVFCNILFQRRSRFFYFFAASLLFLALIDSFLERTIFRVFPRLAWTYTVLCEKHKSIPRTGLSFQPEVAAG